MRKEKNVMIVTPDKKLSKQAGGALLPLGYRIAGECKDGAGALRLARMLLPQLLVIDDDLPDQKGLAIGKILAKEQICPVIVFSNKWNYGIETYTEEGLLAVLAKPMQQDVFLQFALCLEAAHGRIFQLETELAKLRKDLENRKIIERAKGMLMAERHWTEEEAYQWLRNTSMERMVSISVLAQEIVRDREDTFSEEAGNLSDPEGV